jgi:hypothetical protein
MARYFLDIANGSLIRDEEGAEFRDLEAATDAAINAIRDILRHEV